MITENELISAIREYENKTQSTFADCQKLSVFYSLYDKLYGSQSVSQQSFDNEPKTITVDNPDTEFMQIVSEIPTDNLINVINELMSLLQLTQPKLYQAVISKLTHT